MATAVVPIDRETLSIPAVAAKLGIGRGLAYELAAEDRLPVPVIRIGRRLVVSRRALEDVLNKTKPDDSDDAA
jgi:predicted DNA-binding transcriptional regulator AlpA